MFFRVLAAAALSVGLPSAAHAEWYEAKSRHFIIYADLSVAELNAYGERLERFDQAMRRLRGMDDPPLTDSQRLTIFALEDEAAVERLVPGALGFYVSDASGAAAVVPRREGWYARRAEMSAESVFFHEYAHHLQLGTAAGAVPAWFSEGFAEFFGTAEVLENGSVRVGKPPMHREWSIQKYEGLTIYEMLAGTLRNLNDRAIASVYGRGWLLTHMLTFDPARRGQLQRYIHGMQSGVDPLQAAKSAFGDDLRDLDRDLNHYFRQKGFKTLVIDGKVLAPGPIALRPLRPAEIATMDVRTRVRAGADKKEAARIAADARKAAAPFPNDPSAQLTLARAELLARDFPAAEAAAVRAATADPKLAAAAVVLGHARMELAKANAAQANWKEIRSWFTKANRIDPESAEPLMLFYRTYLYAGVQPTPNAVEGLLYAVALAPRDEDLRIDAVRQLVVDNRIADARKYFAPAAFYPHSGREWRARKSAIVDALAKSDRAAALALLDAEQKKRWNDEDED